MTIVMNGVNRVNWPCDNISVLRLDPDQTALFKDKSCHNHGKSLPFVSSLNAF